MTTTREERSIEVNVISANGLKKVKTFGKQVSYVVVYVTGGKKLATRKDMLGGVDPTWNTKLTLHVDEQLIEAGCASIIFEIYSRGHSGDRNIGTVTVPLAEIVRDGSTQYIASDVQRSSGSAKGVLRVAITVGETRPYAVQASPVIRGQANAVAMAYPPQVDGQRYEQADGGGDAQQGSGQQQHAQRRRGGGFGKAVLGLVFIVFGRCFVEGMIGDMGDGGL